MLIWCVVVEHQRSSSLGYLIIRLTNYSITTSLIYKNLIGDIQEFQSTALSKDFSDEILKEIN